MPNNKNNAPVKMSLGEFIGAENKSDMSALPTRPKERGPNDDGSFRRRDYNDNRREREQETSRSDSDNNWRRGVSGKSDSTFGDFDNRRRGGYDRRGGGGNGVYSRDYDSRERDRDDVFDRRGGSGFDNRNGFDRRGGPNDGFGSARFSEVQAGNSVRPKLQLKSRTVTLAKQEDKKEIIVDETKDTASDKKNGAELKKNGEKCNSSQIENTVLDGTNATKEELDSSETKNIRDGKPTTDKGTGERKVVKKREPEVVNSRAAALESAPDLKRDTKNINRSENRDKNERYRVTPPPVVNKRFEQLAEEERGKQKELESRRQFDNYGPPTVTNSRFAAAAEADKDKSYNHDRDNNDIRTDNRGPPPVANSRFAAAAAEAERDGSYDRDHDNNDIRMGNRSPPPLANSRFATAAAEAEADRDRSSYYRDRDNNDIRTDNFGPPPTVNSRFAAAAAEADRDRISNRDGDNNDIQLDNRGPPPVANSRFAIAAAEADRDRSYNRNRDNNDTRMDNRGPPPIANSRFAAAAAEAERDRSYDRDRDRDRGNDDVYNEDGNGQNGWGNRRYDAKSEGYRDHGYNDGDPRRYGNGTGMRQGETREHHIHKESPKSSVADLLKPKARPVEENILKVPTKEQSDNFLKPPSKEKVENTVKPTSTEKSKSTTAPKSQASTPLKSVDDSDILSTFASGDKLGNDLHTWLESLAVVPSVEKLVFYLLTENQKSNPDMECSWAAREKYGIALLSIVEDDLLKQMEVLFAVQNYCNTLGMPKLDDEYLVQAMFRAMYKYDLADDETFMLWKEDESAEHEAGKLKAVIQTVDWFNWLEEDDDEEDDENYEE